MVFMVDGVLSTSDVTSRFLSLSLCQVLKLIGCFSSTHRDCLAWAHVTEGSIPSQSYYPGPDSCHTSHAEPRAHR